MSDTYDEWNSRNPINEKETELEAEQNEIDYLTDELTKSKQRLDYKIWQLQTLAIIGSDFTTYGTITYEQQLQKIEILNQYAKWEHSLNQNKGISNQK